ncbi:hemolysin III family protein [bacterium]|nr:hemolysin III family protein [bacterium]
MIAKLRDPVSGLTHFIGIILAIIGFILLILKATDPIRPWHIVSFTVFSTGMVLVYLFSTLYHWLPLSERGVQRLRRVDHIMIFIMIAATYTPICLIPLRDSIGWEMFGGVWAIAAAGLFLKVFWLQAPRWLSVAIYILMGWLIILGIVPLVESLQPNALFWLVSGGLFYTFGAIIYSLKRPDPWPKRFGFHEIFHVFVMLGTFSHYIVMYKYISLIHPGT